MKDSDFRTAVDMAALVPSVRNTQPARWKRSGDTIEISCDTSVSLKVGDPELRDAGLSCGAAVEATVLALSRLGYHATVDDLWSGNGGPMEPVARIVPLSGDTPDPLGGRLSERFTHRGPFDTEPVPLVG